MDLTRFAADVPLRASALSELVKCHWRAVMLALELAKDVSGQAADTGSACHAAVSAWHVTGDVEQGLRAMRERLAEYPLADTVEAERFYRDYVSDPRNRTARIILNETFGEAVIEPAPYDATRLPIRITGHIDQVREESDGTLCLYDLKTGSRLDGFQMTHEHALQIAAYCRIAQAITKRPVEPGAIIRVRGYRARDRRKEDPSPPGVFFEFPWDRRDIDLLLDSVRDTVARIRRGEFYPSPGVQCSYCPAGGLGGCLPSLKRFLAE